MVCTNPPFSGPRRPRDGRAGMGPGDGVAALVQMYSVSARTAVPVVAWSGGDIDRACSATLRTALTDLLGSHGPRLVLDLRDLAACDQASARVIHDAATRAGRRGGWLRVVTETPGVECVLAGHAESGPAVYSTVPGAVAAP